MEAKTRIFVTIAILAGLVALFYFSAKTITNITGKSIFRWLIKDSTNLEDFAKCLSVKGAKMYGAFWCGHCQNQKKSFGDSWKFVSYVECDPRGENPETELCLSKKIQGYPAWEINNQLYPGEMSFEELAELSGCELES